MSADVLFSGTREREESAHIVRNHISEGKYPGLGARTMERYRRSLEAPVKSIARTMMCRVYRTDCEALHLTAVPRAKRCYSTRTVTMSCGAGERSADTLYSV